MLYATFYLNTTFLYEGYEMMKKKIDCSKIINFLVVVFHHTEKSHATIYIMADEVKGRGKIKMTDMAEKNNLQKMPQDIKQLCTAFTSFLKASKFQMNRIF